MSEIQHLKTMHVFESEDTVQIFRDNMLMLHISKRLSMYQVVVEETLSRISRDDI